ncbi:hypothetical protein SDC9_65442 [bioreactor metagenome]|uniref:DUF4367 domain-containing protein n=1 Tax=bioreactor metagenome TaxID=1076179 RepID=A0A644XYB1_9ZZZZ
MDESDDNAQIVYMEFESSANPTVDSENASLIKEIDVSGNSGTLIVKDSVITVVWQMEDQLLMIQSSEAVGEDETIKMAESVEFVK